jgi:hypothetical protein
MGLPIHAKILNVLGKQTFAMNMGKNKGVSKNMKFEIIEYENQSPSRSHVKARVKVVEVYDKFSLVEIDEKAQKVLGKEESPKIIVGDDLLQII